MSRYSKQYLYKIQLTIIKLCHHNLLQLKWNTTCLATTTIKRLPTVYMLMKLNHHRRNNNLLSLLSPTVQDEISRIETNEAKHCYQIYKRTRIFVTPRVVEPSMKSNFVQNLYQPIITNTQKISNRHKRSRMPQNAMKGHVITNLSADILLRRLLT